MSASTTATVTTTATATHKTGLPYKVDAEWDVMTILSHRHEIPYHSRPFMWNREAHIEYVMKEILSAFHANEEYWLGMVILYTGDEYPSISDAQHRITLCFLIVLALSQLLEKPKLLSKISKYGDDDDDILTPIIPDADREILDRYGWTRLPNIVSCYEEDLEALGNLLNNKEPEDASSSQIYNAFAVVKEILTTAKDLPTPANHVQLLRYLYSPTGPNMKVLRIAISDWRFTLRVFNSFNNIKVPVPPSYLLKNAFTTALGLERSEEIHALFCELKRSRTPQESYEQFIHNVMNMYIRTLLPYKDYERTVGALVGERHVYTSTVCPLRLFKETADRLDAVTESINQDPYGRLFLRGLSRGCEVMNLCLRPLGIVALETGDMAAFQVALRSLCAFAIRLQSPVSFNKLAYQTAMCGIMNPLLEGKATLAQAVTALQVQLRKWLSGVSQDAVTDSLSTRTYSTKSEFQLARASLLYLVLKSDCHEMTLNVDATQIDHIYPKKPKAGAAPLANKDNCHRLGNFTPLVGSNSTGGMKGNCALGNCSFTEKVPHYTTSNLKMTRAVAERYGAVGVFLDEAIEERSRELAGLLATETAKELGL